MSNCMFENIPSALSPQNEFDFGFSGLFFRASICTPNMKERKEKEEKKDSLKTKPEISNEPEDLVKFQLNWEKKGGIIKKNWVNYP